jgi:ketosteroid isomerase-like protein
VSDADVEAVRRGVEAYNRGDVDGVLEMADPEVTLVPIRSLLEGGAYTGHEGLREFLADMDEDWERREVEVDEIRDLNGRVLVLGNFHAVGRSSGSEVRQPVAWLCEMRAGRLRGLKAFSDQDSALSELGLSA